MLVINIPDLRRERRELDNVFGPKYDPSNK